MSVHFSRIQIPLCLEQTDPKPTEAMSGEL